MVLRVLCQALLHNSQHQQMLSALQGPSSVAPCRTTGEVSRFLACACAARRTLRVFYSVRNATTFSSRTNAFLKLCDRHIGHITKSATWLPSYNDDGKDEHFVCIHKLASKHTPAGLQPQPNLIHEYKVVINGASADITQARKKNLALLKDARTSRTDDDSCSNIAAAATAVPLPA